MNKTAFAVGLVSLLLFAADAAHSQDTNYWTLQYGTRGELLGGCVVGSAVDLSATYYNPGSLAFIIDPSNILTASVIGMETISVKDVEPDENAISSRRIGTEPSLFAGTLPVHWFGGQVAYSFLTRQKLDFRLTEREGAVIGLDEDQPADSLSLGGEIIFDQYASEYWGGLTWAKKANERFAYGATLYGVYRSQSRSTRQTVEAFGASGYGASLLDWSDFDYWNYRVLAKVGVSGQFGATTVGLAFTSGSATLFGSGTILINRVVVGDVDRDGIPDSHADVTYGKELDSEYKSPVSIALGASHRFSDTSIHFTVEYFEHVDPYVVMETPAVGTSPGVTTHPAAVKDALKEVFNWGVGFERRFSEKTTAYISFITDRSANENAGTYDISVSTWDIYHINGGAAFSLLGTDLTVGGGFAWGSEPLPFTPDSQGTLRTTTEPSEVKYSRIKAILGISL